MGAPGSRLVLVYQGWISQLHFIALLLTSSLLGAAHASRTIRSLAEAELEVRLHTNSRSDEQQSDVDRLAVELRLPESIEGAGGASDVIVPFFGVNANLMNDRRRTEWPNQGFSTAIRELGAGILRYPGGEMADSYLWSVPPFSKSDPRMARVGPEEVPCWDDPSEGDLSYDWFGCDPRQSDFPLKLSPETLGFDDFMTSAARAGAHVNLVVPLDGASEFHGDDQIQTRSIGVEEMLRTATEWVAYCKGRYNVTLWEVGNQAHYQLSSGDYSLWLPRFSVAMKAVNPAVKIGVPGDDPTWLDAVLKEAGSHVDWISVSASPLENFASHADYTVYLTNKESRADPPFEELREVLRRHSVHRDESLWFAVTSLSASSKDWGNGDPIRGVLAFSDELLRLSVASDVRFLQFSGTKWFNDQDPLRSALNTANDLTPVGEALALCSRAFSALGSSKLRLDLAAPLLSSYASIDGKNGEGSMVLINHGERTRVSLQLGGLLKHLKDSDLQATDQWEASSFVLRPGKDAGSGLTKWAQPLVQGLEVDPAALIVDVDVPSLSMMSLRIKRTSKKELRALAITQDVPKRGRYLILVDDLASPFTPYILRIQDLMRSLTAAGHEVVHFLETSDDVKCPDSSRQAFLEETGALWMCGRGGRLFQLLKQREHAHESFDAVMMMPWYWYSPNIFERHENTIRSTRPETAVVVLSDDAHGARARRLLADFQEYPHLPFSPDPDVEAREARIYARADVVVTVSEEDAQLICRNVSARAECFAWTWSTNTTLVPIPEPAQLKGFEERSGMALMGDFHNPTTTTALQWFIWNVLPGLQVHFSERNERVPLTLVGSGFQAAIFIPLLAQLEKALKLSSGVGPLEFQIFPEGKEAVALLQTQRVMLAPVQASTGVNTKAFFGMSIGLPVVATQAALSGYFPRKATGAGGWEPVPVRTFCGRNLTQDDVFFVGASPDEYTAALIDAYSNEKAWQTRLENSLEVARCLMNEDAQAAIGRRLTTAVAKTRTHLRTSKPGEQQSRRFMLNRAPVTKALEAPTFVSPSPKACVKRADRSSMIADYVPGWFLWPAAAATFLLRDAIFYALSPSKTLARSPSRGKKLERSGSVRALIEAKKLWMGFFLKGRWGSSKWMTSIQAFLLLSLIYTGLAFAIVGGSFVATSFLSRTFYGPPNYFDPAVASKNAGAIARLVAPPVDVDCSCEGFDYFLVIGVSSAAHARVERQNVRDTWVRFAELVPKCPVMVRFITGRHKDAAVMEMVAREMEKYGDIVQDLSIDESYDALSKKTASFHRWAAENVSFMFAFKTDDDIFVRIDRLVLALYQVRNLPRVYWGNLGFMKFPVKDTAGEWSKWYSSFWPAGLPYPLFGRGHGFAVKCDLVRVLAQWENKLDCNGLEDVCTGIHIASDHVYEATNRQGINVVHLMETGLPIFEDIHTDYDDTQCEEGMVLALHLKRPVDTMRSFVETFSRCGRMCGCGDDPEGLRNRTVLTSAFKLRQLQAAAARAAWPYFDLGNPETEMYHDKYRCLFTQADYHSPGVQAQCR